jgi:hypothetical protein
MIRALLEHVKNVISSDGALWILGLDGILLIPLIFAVFFYPYAVLMSVGAVLAVTAVLLLLLRYVQGRHRHA